MNETAALTLAIEVLRQQVAMLRAGQWEVGSEAHRLAAAQLRQATQAITVLERMRGTNVRYETVFPSP